MYELWPLACPRCYDLINDSRKSAVIDRELAKRSVDMAALQETRHLEKGSIRELEYKIYWSGKPAGPKRQHGVGLAVKNSLCNKLEGPYVISDRIMIARFSLEKGHAKIIFAYAPTLIAQPEVKDLFYAALAQVVESVPKSEKLILLGDFNVRVGNDRESWPVTIGAFGIGKINDTGQRLLDLCLCVANTYTQ